MAYPYIPSGGLVQAAFQQFRKSLPVKVDSDILKKLGIASSNEGALINIMKFIGVIDKDNQRTKEGAQVFSTHDDSKFGEALSKLVEAAYSELFDLHGPGAWTLDRDALISYFRHADETSAVTGSRQALTFQTLASLSLKRAEQVSSRSSNGPRTQLKEKAVPPKKKQETKNNIPSNGRKEGSALPVAMTVRIEINLPANGSRDTYDNIFESIRKNLLNDPD